MNNRPNVILMFADDLGIGDLSCFNPDSKIITKNLDKLALEGIRGTDVHATSSLCSPSRYGLLTGRYNWRSALKSKVLGGYTKHLIEDGRSTLGTLFKSAGYRTACIGKWHLGLDWAVGGDTSELAPEAFKLMLVPDVDYTKPVKNGPGDYGFDYSYVTPGSLDIAPYVFLENGMVTQPPLGKTGSNNFAHKRGVVSDVNDSRIYEWPEGWTSADYVHQNVVPDSAERVLGLIDSYSDGTEPFFIYYPIHAPHIPCLPTPEFAGKSPIGPYGDMVLMIDDIVGRIMDKLDEKGIRENTVFVFTSDNGSENSYPELGHEPSSIYRGHKADIWDGGHRIPFIVRWPEQLSANGCFSQMCCLSDMYATFAELLGVEVADDAAEDSVSVLPLWNGSGEQIRDYVVHSSGMGRFAIRKGKWKLELCPYSGGFGDWDYKGGLPPIQLYDMENDVRETQNVYAEHPDVVEELRSVLIRCITEGRSTPGAPQKNTGPEWWPELEAVSETAFPGKPAQGSAPRAGNVPGSKPF